MISLQEVERVVMKSRPSGSAACIPLLSSTRSAWLPPSSCQCRPTILRLGGWALPARSNPLWTRSSRVSRWLRTRDFVCAAVSPLRNTSTPRTSRNLCRWGTVLAHRGLYPSGNCRSGTVVSLCQFEWTIYRWRQYFIDIYLWDALLLTICSRITTRKKTLLTMTGHFLDLMTFERRTTEMTEVAAEAVSTKSAPAKTTTTTTRTAWLRVFSPCVVLLKSEKKEW